MLLHHSKLETIKLSQSQRRTGRQSAFQVPFPTAIQSHKVASDRHKDTDGSRPTTADVSEEKSSRIKTTSQVESKPEVHPPISTRLENKGNRKPSGIKREQSDIFKSFTKPKPKLKREDTDSSVGESSSIPSVALVRQYSVCIHLYETYTM